MAATIIYEMTSVKPTSTTFDCDILRLEDSTDKEGSHVE